MQGDVPEGSVPEGELPAWDCGVRPIGFLPGADGAMAVAHHCAYTGGGAAEEEEETGVDYTHAGVRVIDVSDPTNPTQVRVLDTGSRELLAAQVSRDGSRSLLATRHRASDMQAREGQVRGRDVLVDVWDVSTCTDPQYRGTVAFPSTNDTFGDTPNELGGPAHNLKFNPDATKLYGSLPLHEVNLANLDDPSTWTVQNLHCAITSHPKGYPPHQVPGLCQALEDSDEPSNNGELPQTEHEPTFSPDGSRLYIGGQLPNPGSNAMWVVDMTKVDPVTGHTIPELLSQTDQAPGHSIDFMTIGGRKYLLHSNEIGGPVACVPEDIRPNFLGFGDRAFVLDVTEEEAPVKTAQVILEDSKSTTCPGNTGGPTTAYHDVDDPLDTTYAVIGFGPAGHRFFDVRPLEEGKPPVEVAYFNHGESSHTKAYINEETGHIWAGNEQGFWVLALEPQVRTALGLDDDSGPSLPPSAAACTRGGWADYTDDQGRPFESQGDCVRFVTSAAAAG